MKPANNGATPEKAAETPANQPQTETPEAVAATPVAKLVLIDGDKLVAYDALFEDREKGIVRLEVDDLAKAYAKQGTKLTQARNDFRDATPAVAKAYCALEVRLNMLKKLHAVPANTGIGEYIESITGQKPRTHALTLKNAFGAFVLNDFITEEQYDGTSNNCLEIAVKILVAVKGVLTDAAVQKAVAELKKPTKNQAKNLRAILASVKPAEKMTAEDAVKAIHAINDNGHFSLFCTEIPDMVADLTGDAQREAYYALGRMMEKIDGYIGAETVDAWTREANQADAGVQITDAGKPRNEGAPIVNNAPETPAEKTESEPTTETVEANAELVTA